ncbi:Nucleolar protein 10 [Conglomerata obtusa]
MPFSEINVIQSLDFPTSCNNLKLTPQFLVSVGTYKPILKIHDLNELALKNERNLEDEPLLIEPLTENAQKLAILRSDRYIEIHAKYGLHHTIRIPSYGRDMFYNRVRAELLTLTDNELVRFNMEEGRFMKSIIFGGRCMHQSMTHNLIAVGGGSVSFFDHRSRDKVYELEEECQSVQFKEDGLNFCVGTDTCIKEYDIRMKNEKYNVKLDNAKLLKYNKNFICVMTDNELCIIKDEKKICGIEEKNLNSFDFENGLFFIANESQNVKTYFNSQIGDAPVWCSFIDDLCEDLKDFVAVKNDFVIENALEKYVDEGNLKIYKNTYYFKKDLYEKIKQ